MTIKVRNASGASGINSIRVRGATATKRAARIKLRTGLGVGDLDQVFVGVDPISVSPSDPFNNFSAFDNPTVTGAVGATVTGGLAPFAYSWSVIAFTAGATPTFASPTAATTNITQTGLGVNEFVTATLQVSVTDSAGQTDSVQFEASFENFNFA